jgi:hypothetical protein
MRVARTSTIRAFVCDPSVTIPAWEPVNETASEIVDRHRAQCVGDPLTGRHEHVVFARVGGGRDLECKSDQLVGRRAHGGEDGDHLRARLASGDDALRDPLELARVADRCAAKLHHDEPGRAPGGVDRRDRFEIGDGHL